MIGERGAYLPFSRKQGAALRLWAVLDLFRTASFLILSQMRLIHFETRIILIQIQGCLLILVSVSHPPGRCILTAAIPQGRALFSVPLFHPKARDHIPVYVRTPGV